ncbi:MAG: hypothetical protein JRC92_11920 [Deltaproteobacteria bacterium]|nr:hypothetical protein [Deltaproteobacteria bacterium]
MNRKISLKWQGPNEFKKLILGLGDEDNELYEQFQCPGVYLHTEDVTADGVEGKEIITYVGKSQASLIRRQLEHYRCYIGGLYSIPFYRQELEGLNESWAPSEKSWVKSKTCCKFFSVGSAFRPAELSA